MQQKQVRFNSTEKQIMSSEKTLWDLLQPPSDWDNHDSSFYLPGPNDEPELTAYWKYADGRKVAQRYKMSFELIKTEEITPGKK